MAKTEDSSQNKIATVIDIPTKTSRIQVILSLAIPFLVIAGVATITYSGKLMKNFDIKENETQWMTPAY
jgi:hypothetical protein